MEQIKFILDTILELLGMIGGAILKALNLFLWGFFGVIILFCVFIAHNFYPKWEKWAENLKR